MNKLELKKWETNLNAPVCTRGGILEPARPNGHKILSLACLPIPPLGHLLFCLKSDLERKTIRTRDPDLARSCSTS